MKRLKVVADWWADMDPISQQQYIEDNPSSAQAREQVAERLRQHDRLQEQQAWEQEFQQQQDAERERERAAADKFHAELKKALAEKKPPPVRRASPKPNVGEPKGGWETHRRLAGKG
jgi:hypothetical protein